jgi:hypothetical protein
VKKVILLYGLLGGVLIAALKLIEYRFLVVEHSLEIYGGIVALLFSALGIWLGLQVDANPRNRRRPGGTCSGRGSRPFCRPLRAELCSSGTAGHHPPRDPERPALLGPAVSS